MGETKLRINTRRNNLYIFIFIISVILAGCNGREVEETTDSEITDAIDQLNNINRIDISTRNEEDIINFDEWIYFGNPDDNYNIYKAKTDGSNLMKLVDARLEGFGNLGEWIYFIDTNSSDTKAKLARIKWDGSNKEVITEENVNSFCMNEDNIFYVYENNIYKIDLDGKLKTKIVSIDEDICHIKLYKDIIYFNDSKGIYSITIDGKNLNSIVEGNFHKFYINNDEIYYYDDKVYSCSLEGMNERLIFSHEFSSVLMLGNDIYYNQEDYLYKLDNENNEIDRIYVEPYLQHFFQMNKYIYCYGYNKIWKIDKDLSNKTVVIGTGNEHNQIMYIKVKDKIITKNHEYEDYITGDFSYKLFEFTHDELGKKISEATINKFDSDGEILYYTDIKSNNLYSIDVITGEKQLILDKNIGSFMIDSGDIYYTDIDNNYNLIRFNKNTNDTDIIIDVPVSNIKKFDDKIYFINDKKIGILQDKTIKYIDVFTSVYSILDKYIYYKNEDDNGKLYKIKIDGTDNSKITDYVVKDICIYDDTIYYVEENGTNLLYNITSNNNKEFIDLLSSDFVDMEIIDSIAYMCYLSEDDMFYTTERYIEDLTYKASYDITKQVNDNWKYFIYDIYNNMGYLYKYNIKTNKIQLIVDKLLADFIIVDKWLYYSGFADKEYHPYINRLNLSTNDTETILSIDEANIYSFSYDILDDYIYYFIDDSSEGIIWKRSLLDGSQSELVNDAISLEDIEDGWLYYQDKEEKKIYRVLVDGTNKEVMANSNSKYIHSNKNELYYLNITEEGSYKGILTKKTFSNNSEQIIITKELSASDLIVVNHTLYYNHNGINKYNLRTGKITKIYNKEVDYFILTGNILSCSIHDGEKYKTVQIPIE
jgi:hypothetical protein